MKLKPFPAGNYMFKVNKRNTRTRCEICSKLTIKTPERRRCDLWFRISTNAMLAVGTPHDHHYHEDMYGY